MSDFLDRIFDNTMPGLQRTMDLSWKRNEAITSNVANAETPGYRAVDVSFAGELENAFGNDKGSMRQTSAKHMDISSSSASHLISDLSGATRSDGNNVDLDLQMGKLSYNSGRYSIAASLMRKKLHMLRMAIRYAMR